MSVPVTSQAMPGPSPQLSQDVAAPHPLQVGGQQALQGQPPLQHVPSHQPQTVAQSHGTGSGSGPPQAKRVRYDSSMAQSHGTGSDSGPPQAISKPNSPIAQYIEYVKTLYRQSVVEKRGNTIKWPPTPSTVYINLVCVDQTTHVSKEEADECTRAMVCDGSLDVILKKKTPIDLSDIAKDVPLLERKVILVEGAPGVGKSTLAWELCRRWERGEIAEQYQLVLLLQLRDQVIRKAQSLSDLLHHPSKAVVQAVENELIATLGANTLIILEGFDELPSTCRRESSVFLRLINGELPHATVLVTSRPWATQDLHWQCSHRIFQHIEILGFTGKQIEDYVTSVFTDERDPASDRAKNIEELMSYIMRYPQIKACMYIPLNSAIVVSVYQESKAGKCILPKTLTELYNALVQTLLLRYLHGHPEYGQRMWKIQSLKEDLPEDVHSKLLAICKLAYSGICSDKKGSVQLIFTNLPPDFETLGLMQSVPQLYVTQGEDMSHNFLHLTVQEFLAALHISTMSPKEQLEHFQRHWEEEDKVRLLGPFLEHREGGRWRVVLRFLAGITKLANLSPEDLRGLLLKTSNEYQIPISGRRIITADVLLSSAHVHWMFEAQRGDIIPSGKSAEVMCDIMLTPLDYYSQGYCISHSHSRWVLRVGADMWGRAVIGAGEVVGEEEVRMLVAGVNTTCETSARVVGLGGSQGRLFGHDRPLSISAVALNMVFIELKNVIHLQELHLNLPAECSSIAWPNLSGLRVLHLTISDKRNWRLDTLLPHLSLESLKILVKSGGGDLGPDDVACIGELFLSSNCPKHVDIIDEKSSITAEVEVKKQSDIGTPLAEKKNSVEHIKCRLDWYSVHYVIAHSSFQWVLKMEGDMRKQEVIGEKEVIGEEKVRRLVAGVDTRCDTSARVVGLRGGEGEYMYLCPLFISAEALNKLFHELKNVIHLQQLHLTLPAECSSIAWPNLSGLHVLHLTISDKRNWRLDTLLPHLSLESLTILVTSDGGDLEPDDVACIIKLLLSSNCPKHVDIADMNSSIIAEARVSEVVHEKQFDMEKKKSVEYIRCRLDWYSVGYVIAHKNIQWVLTGEEEKWIMSEEEKRIMSEEEVRMLVAGVSTRCDTSARVVGLRGPLRSHFERDVYCPLSISAEALNMLFVDLKDVIHLQELYLNLPAECCSIHWPDLSGICVLHLGINDKKNWRLDTLLPHLSLESLTIELTRDSGTVALEDCVAIGMLHSSSDCLKYLHFRNVTMDPQPMQSITKAISDKQSLPLRDLVVEGCTLYGTAAHCLAIVISKCTALHHLKILRCTLSAHGLLELAQAIHHSFSLQERELEDLTCRVDGDDEATDAELSVDCSHMKDCLCELIGSHISDRGTQAIATVLSLNFTLEKLDLSNNSISDAGLGILAQALCHHSNLMELNLSNNNISGAGLAVLAPVFHNNHFLREVNLSNNSISGAGLAVLAPVFHNNHFLREVNLSNNSIGDIGLAALAEILSHRHISHERMKLNLSGNGAISARGIHHLVKALTDWIHSFERGVLVLPRRCEEYATQCPQYSTVQGTITFD